MYATKFGILNIYSNIIRFSENVGNTNLFATEIKAVKRYINLNQLKVQNQFLEDNRGKAGIYMWTNPNNGNTYIGSSVNLSPRFLKYLNENALKKN